MAIAAQTPADLVITPRNRAFGRKEQPGRWWYGGDPAATAFFNVLSLTFPKGETYFIESVKHYRDEMAEPLRSQIGDFIKQEAIHTREHLHFNRQVKEAGYDLRGIEGNFEQVMNEARERPPLMKLTSTVALEHFTAILAHVWLSQDRYFKDAPEDVKRLWLWHSMEEIEHKSVAYDTFLAVTAPMPTHKRYKLRCLMMLLITRRFLAERMKEMAELFRQDGVNTVKTWAKVWSFFLIYPGVLRQVFPAWLSFFRPGFHPWMHDDRDLLRKAEQMLGAAGELEPA